MNLAPLLGQLVIGSENCPCKLSLTPFLLSARYRAKVEAAKIRLSMSRPGMPYDNAMAESFFSSLKLELIPGRTFATHEVARLAVFDYIESFYNRIRLHSALNYLSPAQYEERFKRLGYVP